MGDIKISISKLRSILNDLGIIYTGATYNLLTQNCNHFSKEFCLRLLGKEIPGWVNRLAGTLNYIKCVVPLTYYYLGTPTGVAHTQTEEEEYVNYSGVPPLTDDDTLADLDSRRRLLESRRNMEI